MKLNVEFEFSAAHRLLHTTHCHRLHGHGYILHVELEGDIDPITGMVMDFDEIDAVVQERVIDLVDHRDLNTFLVTPTAENILRWFWLRLKSELPALASLRLLETRRYSAVYDGAAGGPDLQYADGYEGP